MSSSTPRPDLSTSPSNAPPSSAPILRGAAPKDIESASPPTSTHHHHPLVPGFHDPPPFLVFLRRYGFDIATQLLCVLTAFLLYLYCPPLVPRYFPLYPGIERSEWGIRHSQPYLKEYVNTGVSTVVTYLIPALIMGAITLWGTRGFGDGNAAVRLFPISQQLLTSFPSSLR